MADKNPRFGFAHTQNDLLDYSLSYICIKSWQRIIH